jgi:parvulin-like peptidyl-prolyl isomerase
MLFRILAAALLVTGGATAASSLTSELHATTQALLQRGLVNQAINELEARVTGAKEPEAAAAVWLELAAVYEAQPDGGGNAAAALVHALEVLAEDAPGRDALHYRLARDLESTGDTVRAANEYQVILVDYPQSLFHDRASQGITRCFEANQPRIAATVGGYAISVEMLDRVIQRMDGVAQSEIDRKPERRMQILKQMTEEKLLADYARQNGVHLERDVREELNHNIDRFLAQHVLQRRVADPVKVTPEETRAYYDAHRDSDYFSEARVRGFTFVLDSKKEAEEVFHDLQAGGFASVHAQLSEESESRGGGDSGLHRLSKFAQPLAEALQGKEVHDALPPRKTSHGWEVFYIQVFNPAAHTSFDTVQPQIKKLLRSRRQQELYAALVDSLKSEIPVTIQATR